MKISVVVPVYNEKKTVVDLINRVREQHVDEIVVVDDCSSDGSSAILRDEAEARKDFVLLVHKDNQGKGAAIRTALENVSGDVVVIQDADLEYDPRDIPKVLQPIIDGKADVVYGSRFHSVNSNNLLSLRQNIANRVLTYLSNLFTGLDLTDMETGAKAFRSEVLAGIELEQERFGFEPEITAKVARMGYHIHEVGINYRFRSYDEGKKIGWRDGVQAMWCIVRYGLRK